VDPRFDLDTDDQYKRLFVATKDIVFAISLRAVSVIDFAGSNIWTVKYETKDGEASVSGELPERVKLVGDSDFGEFSLLLGKLKRLEFSQKGVAQTEPAKRTEPIFASHGPAKRFVAILTLNDGTSIQASDLRRHAGYENISENNYWIPSRHELYEANEYFTDFRFIRGETSQTIPFDKIKTVDFALGESVTVTTKTDAKAEMKLSHDKEGTITGLTGTCIKGEFYVPATLVRSITFGDALK
jgi:hypothetical protein